jgi:hypothetical protein
MQQTNLTTSQPKLEQGSAPPEPTPAHKLERARERVKSALHAAEDGDLNPVTFDDIARPLVLALREMDELTISLGALSRAGELHTN